MDKKYGIVQKTLITDGIAYSGTILMGILCTVKEPQLWTVIIGTIILVITAISFLFRKVKTEPWDEMTKEYYNEARKITMNLIYLMIVVLGLILGITRNGITITSSTILIIAGFIGLFQTFAYVWIERKNSNLTEE